MSQWVRAWEWCVKTPGVPAILANYAKKRALPIIDRKAKVKPAIRFPKGKDPKKEKKRLHAECEALCKAQVFQRDCGDWRAREGKCITCGKFTALQWGHFLPRQKAPKLLYSVIATGAQCGGCNGPPLHGNFPEFVKAIDRREGDPGYGARLYEQYNKVRFTWNKTALQTRRDHLVVACRAQGIPVEDVLAKVDE